MGFGYADNFILVVIFGHWRNKSITCLLMTDLLVGNISRYGADGDNLLGFTNNKTCSSKVHEANQQGTQKQNWRHFHHFAFSLSLLVTFCFNKNLDVEQMSQREIDWPNQVASIFVFLNRPACIVQQHIAHFLLQNLSRRSEKIVSQ